MTEPIPTNIVQETIKLLSERNHRFNWSRIEKDTGIPRGWLSMFARGKITDPSYLRLIKLYNYLIANR